MATKPNLIAAYVQVEDDENVSVKIRHNEELSTKERFVYLTYLQQAIKEQADKVKALHEREQRRKNALARIYPTPAVQKDCEAWKPGATNQPIR